MVAEAKEAIFFSRKTIYQSIGDYSRIYSDSPVAAMVPPKSKLLNWALASTPLTQNP